MIIWGWFDRVLVPAVFSARFLVRSWHLVGPSNPLFGFLSFLMFGHPWRIHGAGILMLTLFGGILMGSMAHHIYSRTHGSYGIVNGLCKPTFTSLGGTISIYLHYLPMFSPMLQVDVYDENSTSAPMIGSWSNLDLLFGMVEWLGIFQGLGELGIEHWEMVPPVVMWTLVYKAH